MGLSRRLLAPDLIASLPQTSSTKFFSPINLSQVSRLPTLLFVVFTESPNSMSLRIGFNDAVPDPPPTAPHVPSPEEAEQRYYGTPSKPRFIARSSVDIWLQPTGLEAYPKPIELRPVGTHRLCSVWEGTIDVALDAYLVGQKVQYTSLDPVRIGKVGDRSAPVTIWVGVVPGSLSAEDGIDIALGCRSILLANRIEDVHVEIRESVINPTTKMYKPAITSNPTAHVREPFSTSLGINICSADTPDIQGTAGLFFTNAANPDKLYLLTARHVLFRSDKDNDPYKYHPSKPRYREEIGGTQVLMDHLNCRLEIAAEAESEKDQDDEDEDKKYKEREWQQVQRELEEAQGAIEALEKILVNVKRDWEKSENRVIGHVVLSPPLSLGAGEEGYTEDWAVVEVDSSMINKTNFVGNAIDLGMEIPVQQLTAWMHPNHANQPSFEYPGDRLLKFHGTISDDEMRNPDPRNIDERNDPTIMVIKRGCTSGLTVGCLNNIRSVLRDAFKNQLGTYSKAIAVLPRSSKSGAFSEGGDSGAVVLNGVGAVAGMITGGGGASGVSDCTYVTSITFLLKRLLLHGIQTHFFPLPAELRD